jgi:anthranilate phosphoribosyltransferase
MGIREAIEALTNERRDLSEEEAAGVMREIFSGEATPAQLGAFLVALRLKGETINEIAGMARVMREHAVRVDVGDDDLLDTCGTGGDGQGTFNVSTAAAFVAAGAGARVAKHGNRAMSSGCGSADVLEALGAKIALGPEGVADCIRQVGFGFMFAQAFHPSMKHAAGPRREIGVRTVFNILGPLTNPAGATRQLVGVANRHLAPRLAEVLKRLGSRHALVVHGHEGVDEVSLSGPTHVHEVIDGETREYTVSPEEFGLTSAPTGSIRGGTPEQNASIMRRILSGEPGPLRDVVLLNAAGALVAGDIVQDLADGVKAAAAAIDSGAAKQRLEGFVELSQSLE